MREIKILTISGSLRSGSSNTRLLSAAARLAPEGMLLIPYGGVDRLPHFNPDLDGECPPPSVAEFRALLTEVDGVLISSPEYAHGVPGALKNALDWVVGSGELVGKPVVLINASTSGGERAQAQLVQTLTVMSAKVLTGVSLMSPLVRRAFDESGSLADPELSQKLRSCLMAFAKEIGTV